MFPLHELVLIPTGDHPGAFGIRRKHHTHEGVDLYCPEGTPVRAVEDGVVTLIEPFTGPDAGSPWWLPTRAVHVEGKSGVILYGEIEEAPGLTAGAVVQAGDILGHVRRVLRHDKGRPLSMLHFELYRPGSRESVVWDVDAPQPETLLDPTSLLEKERRCLVTN